MAAQTHGEISIPEDIQNSTEHGLKQADMSWPCPVTRTEVNRVLLDSGISVMSKIIYDSM